MWGLTKIEDAGLAVSSLEVTCCKLRLIPPS